MRILTFLAACCLSASAAPNIVFLFSDDHALNAISAYGGRLKDVAPTPNIDRIAREGMIFERSYCTNSICGPSRASIITGKHSHLNGFRNNDSDKFDGTQQTFPKLLQKAGYTTAMIGKWHLVTQPTGFDHWDILPGQGSYYNPDFISENGKERVEGYCTDIITDKAIDWLENRPKDKPFILMCQHKAPHRPWIPAERHYTLFDDVTIPEPDSLFDDYADRSDELKKQQMTVANHFSWGHDMFLPRKPKDPRFLNMALGDLRRMNKEQKSAFDAAYGPKNEELYQKLEAGMSDKELTRWKYQRYMKNYLRCVRALDENIGRMLDYLDESGLAKDTIVIYSSDQGFYLGEHGWYDKRWMFEQSLSMPFLIRWPGVVKPGIRSQALIQNIDYAPTFLEAAGAPIPSDIQGRSLLPVLKIDGEAPNDWRKAIYYAYYGERTHHVAAHDGVRDDRYKLFRFTKTGEWQLFDLKNDPDEMHDISGDPANAETLERMKALYQEMRTKYEVP
ncbi:MAG: sulfatase [Akkermansiaceae bacterium]|nr:sulfatase [Akkermansiaceae bacterium]